MDQKIYFPNGFPYVLFINELEGDPKFFLAVSKDQAMLRTHNKGTLDTLKVIDLISGFGHKDTHNFLKRFGDKWMTKDGMVFYENDGAVAF